MNERVIQIDNVTIRYGKRAAVDAVSLEVKAGSVFALLGRNGAGKSSLIKSLLGFMKPNAGAIRLFGEDVWKHRARLMERVGFVAEDPDAPPEMTGAEVVRFCARLAKRWDQRDADERLKRFNVPLDVPFGRLSKGQRREVLLAVALATSPELLILDDPTLGLDVVARKELYEELVSDLADRGITVFITTHDLAAVESLADHIAILRDGSIVLNEEVEQLKWRFRKIRYATPAAADVPAFREMNAVGVRRWGSGVEAVVSNYSDVSLEHFRSSSGVRDVEVTPMSLEEIFIALTEEEREKEGAA